MLFIICQGMEERIDDYPSSLCLSFRTLSSYIYIFVFECVEWMRVQIRIQGMKKDYFEHTISLPLLFNPLVESTITS